MSEATTWRLLIESDLPGAENMARDSAILHGVGAGSSPATLRLYGWAPACLSLGKHQGFDAADLDFCAAHAIDVVRRPTGGRAVLHHLELTYSVIAPLGLGPVPRALQTAYSELCTPLVQACRQLGIDAELTGGEVNLQLPGPRTTVPCFKAPAGGEVVVAGRKLIGSAMRSHRGIILQHGAILLDWDGGLQAGSMGLEDDSSLRPSVTTFAEQLDRVPSRAEVEEAISQAYAEVLAVVLEAGELSPEELAYASRLRPEFVIQDCGA